MYGEASFMPDANRAGLYVKPQFSPRDVIVRDAAGRVLYAVTGNRWNGKAFVWEGPLYFSASDQASAEYQFKHRFWHFHFIEVWAAPAIGFFVHDNHGDQLSAGGDRPEIRPGDEHAT